MASKTTIPDQISVLNQMSADDLRHEWQRLYGSVAPSGLSRDLLQRAIAWKIQEMALGGHGAAVERQLASPPVKGDPAPKASVSLQPRRGARLVREWRGELHHVDTIEGGYLYRGQRYVSLSQVARVITGTRWSGPLFFGLRKSLSAVGEKPDAQ